jgi:arylsulfatase A-like enzyme
LPAIPSKRPNVIWIFGDQHRAQALGYRGDPNVKTPHIDALAARGVRFDCAVAGAPWCTPFRSALFTGQYPHKVGCTRTPSPAIDPNIPTIAKPFREAGYHTALVGKWHLGGTNQEHFIPPEHRGGFDYWMGFETGNTTFDTVIHGNDHDELVKLPGFHTDGVTDVFVRHLKDHAGKQHHKPFFGVLSVRAPHDPYESPSPFDRHKPEDIIFRPNVPDVPWVREKTSSELPHYYGMIENLDWNVGRVLDTLRELGIDRNTWIIFFSDHGDSHGSHAMYQKSNPYEESIRIPMLIAPAATDSSTACRGCDATMNHVDIAPTTLGLCGLTPPAWMVGHDYATYPLDLPSSQADEPDSAYLQQVHAKTFPAGIDIPWRGVVTRDGWKYICTPGQRWLMFDLNTDPYEQANLAFNTRFMAQRERLHERLAQWINHTQDDFTLPAMAGV